MDGGASYSAMLFAGGLGSSVWLGPCALPTTGDLPAADAGQPWRREHMQQKRQGNWCRIAPTISRAGGAPDPDGHPIS